LRDAGIEVPIHVFTETFALLLSEQAAARGLRAAVQLKLDTGMHRVGLLADDVPDAIRALRDLPGLEIEGAWSHLAVADVPDHPFTRKQVELFENLTGRIEASGIQLRYRHIANSAATLSTPETHFDMVRCGVACYGLWPGSALEGSAPLRPALALRALVVMSKVVPAGDGLSYGLEYHLERSGNVITVGAGYADGYDRRLSGTADVLLHGRRHRVSGVVCMDQFLVDVGDRASDVGDVVTLLGADGDENISAEELAAHIGTINYEVTTRIPSRVPRVYLEGES
ncbi:MAG: alanine racemase, partial [Actinomycetota bacterium]|nr:alanine racemase [Actinomycetota bacterium]